MKQTDINGNLNSLDYDSNTLERSDYPVPFASL